jgi:hypothetical protein
MEVIDWMGDKIYLGPVTRGLGPVGFVNSFKKTTTRKSENSPSGPVMPRRKNRENDASILSVSFALILSNTVQNKCVKLNPSRLYYMRRLDPKDGFWKKLGKRSGDLVIEIVGQRKGTVLSVPFDPALQF